MASLIRSSSTLSYIDQVNNMHQTKVEGMLDRVRDGSNLTEEEQKDVNEAFDDFLIALGATIIKTDEGADVPLEGYLIAALDHARNKDPKAAVRDIITGISEAKDEPRATSMEDTLIKFVKGAGLEPSVLQEAINEASQGKNETVTKRLRALGEKAAKGPKTAEADAGIEVLYEVERRFGSRIKEIGNAPIPENIKKDMVQCIKDSVTTFLKSHPYDLREVKTFSNMPIQFYLIWGLRSLLLNNLPEGTLFYCAASALEEGTTNIQSICNDLAKLTFTLQGVASYNLLDSPLLPIPIINEIRTYYVAVAIEIESKIYLRQLKAYKRRLERQLQAKGFNVKLISPHREKGEGLEDEDDDYDPSADSLDIHRMMHLAHPSLAHVAAAAASSGAAEETPLEKVKAKLEALITAGTPISIDSLTVEELGLISNDKETIKRFLPVVQHETVYAKSKLLKEHFCKGKQVKEGIKDLSDGDVKKAWLSVCRPFASNVTLIIVIIGISLSVIVAAIVLYIYFRHSGSVVKNG